MRRFGWMWVSMGLLVIQAPSRVLASDLDGGILHRDSSYEQDLRNESSADQIITPGRVIRWLFNSQRAAAQTNSRLANAEFQPIVNVKDSKVRVVAAVAYTF